MDNLSFREQEQNRTQAFWFEKLLWSILMTVHGIVCQYEFLNNGQPTSHPKCLLNSDQACHFIVSGHIGTCPRIG